jgi:hypothetical protein
MKKFRYLFLIAMLGVAPQARAQQFKLPASIEHLGSKASEVVEVNLDERMLRLAAKFLDSEDVDDAEAKRIIANLKGIYVRSYEFDKAGAYNNADIDPVRAQFNTPEWARIVGVRSVKDKENVDIFVRPEGDHINGMWIIATEPTELTVVNLIGPMDPEKISVLGGQFGIPRVKKGGKQEAGR